MSGSLNVTIIRLEFSPDVDSVYLPGGTSLSYDASEKLIVEPNDVVVEYSSVGDDVTEDQNFKDNGQFTIEEIGNIKIRAEDDANTCFDYLEIEAFSLLNDDEVVLCWEENGSFEPEADDGVLSDQVDPDDVTWSYTKVDGANPANFDEDTGKLDFGSGRGVYTLTATYDKDGEQHTESVSVRVVKIEFKHPDGLGGWKSVFKCTDLALWDATEYLTEEAKKDAAYLEWLVDNVVQGTSFLDITVPQKYNVTAQLANQSDCAESFYLFSVKVGFSWLDDPLLIAQDDERIVVVSVLPDEPEVQDKENGVRFETEHPTVAEVLYDENNPNYLAEGDVELTIKGVDASAAGTGVGKTNLRFMLPAASGKEEDREPCGLIALFVVDIDKLTITDVSTSSASQNNVVLTPADKDDKTLTILVPKVQGVDEQGKSILEGKIKLEIDQVPDTDEAAGYCLWKVIESGDITEPLVGSGDFDEEAPPEVTLKPSKGNEDTEFTIKVGADSKVQDGVLDESEVATKKEVLYLARANFAFIEVIELRPLLKDEKDADIAETEIPKLEDGDTNPMIKVPADRVAYRDIKIKIGDPGQFNGKKVKWSMEPLFVPSGAQDPVFRGDLSQSSNHSDEFEESTEFGSNFGFSKNETENTFESVIDANGFTAVRANLAPIGFNQSRIRVEVEGHDSGPIPIVDMEVPAVIVVDPGHGMKENGIFDTGATATYVNAVGATVEVEEQFLCFQMSSSLMVALESHELKRKYLLRTFTTREHIGQVRNLEARPIFAKNKGADIFLSIHFNSFVDSAVRGTETLYHQARPSRQRNLADDARLANLVQGAALRAMKAIDRSAKSHGDPIKGRTLAVLRDDRNGNVAGYTPMRAVLVEVEYISNPQILKNIHENIAVLAGAFAAQMGPTLIGNIREPERNEP